MNSAGAPLSGTGHAAPAASWRRQLNSMYAGGWHLEAAVQLAEAHAVGRLLGVVQLAEQAARPLRARTQPRPQHVSPSIQSLHHKVRAQQRVYKETCG